MKRGRPTIPRGAIAALALAAAGLRGAAPGVQLPPVDVVAAPIVEETTTGRFGYQTTVVGREQIADLNAGDLAAALRRTPGVAIARYNTVGAFGGGEGGAVFVRGLGSSRPGGEIRTTLDGVPVGNGIFNHPLLDLLPVELSGGVEIARRAEPLAMGNMFAAIHVLTPRVAEDGVSARVAASVGSFGARSGRAEFGVKGAAGELLLGANHREAEGHRPDAAGELNNLLVRGAWRPLPALELSYVLHRSDNRAVDPGPERGSGLPATRGDVYVTETWLHLAEANGTRRAGQGGVKLYSNFGDANWYRRTTSANADSLNDYRLSGIRWREQQRPWEGGEVVGGVDVDWSRGTSRSVAPTGGRSVTFGPETFRLASAFAGVAHRIPLPAGWEVQPSAGTRAYRHQVFGREWSPQAGVVARRGAWQFHASWGRAVRFPGLEVAAFSTIALPALGQTWRALGPERMSQTEVGFRREWSERAALELTLFRNDGRDRYVFVAPPPPPFRFANAERFRTQGAEATLTVRPSSHWSLFAGVAGLEVSPTDLPYAPRWSASAGVTWRPWRHLTVNVDGSVVDAQRAGSQTRGAGAVNSERIPSMALLNARVGWHLPPFFLRHPCELFGAIENLLDRGYRYRPGYPMPGRGVTGGIEIRF